MGPAPVSGSPREAIFISYRRDDARGASGRVWDWLRIGFGRERVFRDVASIGAGKWRRKIEQALAASRACVVVIGRRWADATNLPRLQDPSDMVRYEVETALARGEKEGLTVVPLLVEEVRLSEIPAQDLPDSLRPLLREWNVLALSESGWDDDTRRLINAIAEATGLEVRSDLADWLGLMAGAQRGLAAEDAPGARQPAGMLGEQLALDDLVRKVAEAPPAERPGLRQAFEALAAGDTLLAEEAFEREVDTSERLIAAEQRRQAEAARNVASLALLRGDLSKAMGFLSKALALDPQLPEANLLLGQARLSRGDLDGAEQAFRRELAVATQAGDGLVEASAHLGLGDCDQARGLGHQALLHLQRAHQLADARLGGKGENPQGRQVLAVALVKLGDSLLALGQRSDALANYGQALRLREAMAAQSAHDPRAQRDWASSLERVAEVHLDRRDAAAALPLCRRSLAIREELVRRDPSRLPWRSDLAIGHIQLGRALQAGGDRSAALESFRQGRSLLETLVVIDGAHSHWQRELACTHNRIGEVLLELDQPRNALTAFRGGLALSEALAGREPGNATWQADLAIGLDRLAELTARQGDPAAALPLYTRALEIRQALVERSPEGSPWRRDLFVSQLTVAETLAALGERTSAVASARRALASAEALLRRDPQDPQVRFDRAEAACKLAAMLAKGPEADRQESYQLLNSSSRTIAELQGEGWPVPQESWLPKPVEER